MCILRLEYGYKTKNSSKIFRAELVDYFPPKYSKNPFSVVLRLSWTDHLKMFP